VVLSVVRLVSLWEKRLVPSSDQASAMATVRALGHELEQVLDPVLALVLDSMLLVMVWDRLWELGMVPVLAAALVEKSVLVLALALASV
jgi:hypothetical protein